MKPSPFLIICMVQIFIFTTVSAQAMSRASYGESCSKEIRCESRNFLTCFNGHCDCLMPDTMVFENATGKCVTLAGERCQYNSVEGESTWTEEVPCISNAICQNGICECTVDYYEISNGSCQLKKEHADECFSNEMCNNRKHLVCGSEQTCICGPNRYLSNGECVLFAGNVCTLDDRCTDFSACVEDSADSVRKCKCKKSYFQADNGTCELQQPLGGDCTDHIQCLETATTISPGGTSVHEIQSFLVCTNGKCQCDDKVAAVETPNIFPICRKYWGEQCSEHECLTGATCSSSGTCQCQSHFYLESSNRTCVSKRSYREICKSNEECQSSLRCDTVTQTCACELEYAFSPETKNCVVGAGHTCMLNTYYSSTMKPCVPNAACSEEFYNHLSGSRYSRRCACTGGYIKGVISDGYCYIKEGGTCDGDDLGPMTAKPCLPGLACRDASCVCLYKDHQVFDQTKGKCFSYAGGPCNETTDCLDANAECSSENGINQCRCKAGFTQVGRSCDRAYGERCTQGDSNPKCDRFGPLECSVREICECSDFQMYDTKILRCRGLVGAKCKSSGNSDGNQNSAFCVKGAACQQFRGFQETYGLCTCQTGWKTETNRTCTVTALATVTVGTVGGLLPGLSSLDDLL